MSGETATKPRVLGDLEYGVRYWVVIRPRSTDNIEIVAGEMMNRDPRAWVSVKTEDGRIFDCFGDKEGANFHLTRTDAVMAAVESLTEEVAGISREIATLQIRETRLRQMAASIAATLSEDDQ